MSAPRKDADPMEKLATGACPDLSRLYDQAVGDAVVDAHVESCAACRAELEALGEALGVEAEAFAPPSELETERALAVVLARGRARARRPWRPTALAFAAASVMLALLLPGAFGEPDARHPAGGAHAAALVPPARDVTAPAGVLEGIEGVGTLITTGAVRSDLVPGLEPRGH